MTSEEKQTQEFNSFRNIPDSFKKIVIVNGTKKHWRNEEGFNHGNEVFSTGKIEIKSPCQKLETK